MRLTLQNGYPYPLPPGFDFDAHNPHMHWVSFDGVRHFEWLHTLTIEFDTQEGARQAIESSGGAWTWWADAILAALSTAARRQQPIWQATELQPRTKSG